jgi:hypothetical protein
VWYGWQVSSLMKAVPQKVREKARRIREMIREAYDT